MLHGGVPRQVGQVWTATTEIGSRWFTFRWFTFGCLSKGKQRQVRVNTVVELLEANRGLKTRTLKRVSTHAAATGCIPSSPDTPFGILGIRSSTDARQHKSLFFVPTTRSNPNICPMKLPFFELNADTSTMRVPVARVCEISSLLLTTVLRRICPSAPFSASMRLKTCPFTL